MREKVEAPADGWIFAALCERVGRAKDAFRHGHQQFQTLFVQAQPDRTGEALALLKFLLEQKLVPRSPGGEDSLGVAGWGDVEIFRDCHPKSYRRVSVQIPRSLGQKCDVIRRDGR